MLPPSLLLQRGYWAASSADNEVRQGHAGGIGHPHQGDAVGTDRHPGIRPHIGDRHVRREGRRGDAEAGDVQQVLTTGRVGVEVQDAVLAEAGTKDTFSRGMELC